MEFAGARSPLIHIANGKLEEIKGNKLPIGGEQREIDRKFTTHQLKIAKSSRIYLFSDGFQDQFGGKQDRKFLSKNFKKLLIDIHSFSSEVQHKKLSDTLTKWRGKQKQIDDILVLGFKA